MIYDITPPIIPLDAAGSAELKVWPGDTPPSREILSEIKDGADVTLSTLHSTVHLGAHADAPSHCQRDGASIDQRRLDYYLGPCQVVSVPADPKARVRREMIEAKIRAPRLLISTGTYPDPTVFNDGFAALSTGLVETLATEGVRLIGIDTPSVDLFESKELPVHRAMLKHDMAILEGLILKDVPDGLYELIALPLRLAGFDASPVRAILRR